MQNLDDVYEDDDIPTDLANVPSDARESMKFYFNLCTFRQFCKVAFFNI